MGLSYVNQLQHAFDRVLCRTAASISIHESGAPAFRFALVELSFGHHPSRSTPRWFNSKEKGAQDVRHLERAPLTSDMVRATELTSSWPGRLPLSVSSSCAVALWWTSRKVKRSYTTCATIGTRMLPPDIWQHHRRLAAMATHQHRDTGGRCIGGAARAMLRAKTPSHRPNHIHKNTLERI